MNVEPSNAPWIMFAVIITILFGFSFLVWLAQPRGWKRKSPNIRVTLVLFSVFVIFIVYVMAPYWLAVLGLRLHS